MFQSKSGQHSPPMSKTALRRLTIDVAVHGRFHAFHLARALHARGHDVRLLTNYPLSTVKKFGFPPSQTVTCLAHGIVTRVCNQLPAALSPTGLESVLHRWFGRWARAKVRTNADLIYIFSSISEETLDAIRHIDGPQIWVVRGSSHVRAQYRFLEEEECRSKVSVVKPSPWMISREEREYAKADRVVTLSTFARESFIGQSVSPDKVILLSSAVDVERFRPNRETVQRRRHRIAAGDALRILMVGSFSRRKGAADFLEIANQLSRKMRFRFVGDVSQDALVLKNEARSLIEFVPRVAEFELNEHYSWGDIFVFPTIEDGFAAVVAQALAAGLPVLATPNSSAPDLVRHGETGWILPTRSPLMFVDQLNWCNSHRIDLEDMIQRLYSGFPQRDWNDMAADLERLYAGAKLAR
jgi:colanic acid/amylovoran biosynthesis glycosyltransferase